MIARKLIVAIDPGTSGGIAWTHWDGKTILTCSNDKRKTFIEWMHGNFEGEEYGGIFEPLPRPVIFVEKVSGYYPKPKIVPGQKPEFNLQASSFSMFNFGKSAGIVLGICEAFDIKPMEVMPAVWQKALFTKKSGTRNQWKNILKEIAQRRYPDVKVTLNNADALLLLSYGTLITRGEIDLAP